MGERQRDDELTARSVVETRIGLSARHTGDHTDIGRDV